MTRTRKSTNSPEATKPAPNSAKPPRPTQKQDVKDIERADSEGMAQPQGLPPHEEECDLKDGKRRNPPR